MRDLTVIQDVIMRRQAECALAEERQRLANLIEATGVGTWEWHVPSGALRLNERWAAIFGWTLAELAPVSVQTRIDMVHPDDLPESMRLLEQHFAGETARYECECRMRHRDGHFVCVLSHGAVTSRDGTGQPEWMFGTLKDITVRKRDEAALRKSEAFLEHTGQLAKVGGWALDIATGIITWTAETYRIHGVPPDYKPDADKVINFYAPETRAVIQAAVEGTLAGGGPWDLELPLIRADGTQIWVRAVGSVELADGKPVQLAGAFQDVTARVAEGLALRQANERVTLATDSGRIGIWDWDIVADTIFWDERMCQLYGIARPTGLGTYHTWRQRLHPDDLAAAEQAVRDAIQGVRDYEVAFRIIWDDGNVRMIRAIGRVIRGRAGQALRMLGSNWDVTEAHRLSTELTRQHEMLLMTMQSIGNGVITTDGDGLIVWLNLVAERLTGWLAAEVVGQKLEQVFRIVNEGRRLPAENPVTLCLARGKTSGLANDTVLISRDGQEFGIEGSVAPIVSAEGKTLGAVLVFHDVTEARRLSGEMSFRASHDSLTGLLNRAEFEVRLRFLLHKAHADRSENALLFIDLDQFKLVNDGCGHAAGDLLLQQVARMLTEAVRASDTLARLGGDEFGVILDHCSVDQAHRLAQRICDRMEEFRFIHEDRRFRIGASIGLVPVDRRWPNIAAVLQAADSSCYSAKEAGRNRVHVWQDSDTAMRARQGETQLATRLTQALDEDRFLLFAQRILPLRGSETCGLHAEVLLRMLAPDATLVQPGAFLPAAERFHLASRIDRWVLSRTVAWMGAVAALAAIDTLCVNLSDQSVCDRVFHRWAIEMLTDAGPAICTRLCLEITETAAVTNLDNAAAFTAQVRMIGVRVALDDFGAGASRFGYLKAMPVDFLKIDGKFIRDLVADPLDEAAVRCFAEVASLVGIRTVAKFVDDAAVLKKLRLMGIDFAQGYLIHRPAPIDGLLTLPVV